MGHLFGLFSKQFSPLRFGKFEEFYGIGGVYIHGVSLARSSRALGMEKRLWDSSQAKEGATLYAIQHCGKKGSHR